MVNGNFYIFFVAINKIIQKLKNIFRDDPMDMLSISHIRQSYTLPPPQLCIH